MSVVTEVQLCENASMVDRTKLFTRLGKLGEPDDKLADYAQWAKLGDEARFQAAWELVVQAALINGTNPDELRFQRSVTRLVRKWR